MLDHYCHYDNLHRYSYRRLTAPRDACWMERYPTTLSSGQTFGCWVNSGEPSHPDAAEMQYITQKPLSTYPTNEVIAEDVLMVECMLRAHEVQIIILKYTERKGPFH